MENPFQTPSVGLTGHTYQCRPSRFLFWFSVAIVGMGLLTWISVLGLAAADTLNGNTNNPMTEPTIALIFTVVLSLVCIPQSMSVFMRSLRGAIAVKYVSIIGLLAALVAAVACPIVALQLNNDPYRLVLLSATGFSLSASLFFLNFRLHAVWVGHLKESAVWITMR